MLLCPHDGITHLFTLAKEKASAELEKWGDWAEPALRQTLDSQPPQEVHRRVARLLAGGVRPEIASGFYVAPDHYDPVSRHTPVVRLCQRNT